MVIRKLNKTVFIPNQAAIALVALLLVFSAGGCRSRQNGAVQTLPETAAPVLTSAASSSAKTNAEISPSPAEVTARTTDNELKSLKGELLVRVHIKLPKVTGDCDVAAVINAYYDNIYEKHMINSKTQLLTMAQQEYDLSVKNGVDFNVYEASQDFELKLNDGRYFSVVRTYSEYSGGARGSQVVYCETFSMQNGGRLSIADVFSVSQSDYLALLYAEVERQIGKRSTAGEEFFENYSSLLRSTFDLNDFYLTPKGIGMIYQPYSLAPYSSGNPTFEILFSQLGDALTEDLRPKEK